MPDTFVKHNRPLRKQTPQQKPKKKQAEKRSAAKPPASPADKPSKETTATQEPQTAVTATTYAGTTLEGFNFGRLASGAASAQGARPYQEDRYEKDEPAGYFAVYDGHGGSLASDYLIEHLKENVIAAIAEADEDKADKAQPLSDAEIEHALVRAFKDTDAEFMLEYVDDGSTCCAVYCTTDEIRGTRTIHCANVGDSRAVLVHGDGTIEELSHDHKPLDPAEKRRIEAAGHSVEIITALTAKGRVKVPRVDGVLALSRAFGDGSMKDVTLSQEECAVTCIPDIKHVRVDPRQMRFVVIACDGVWDVISSERAGQIVVEFMRGVDREALKTDKGLRQALTQAAEKLVQTALEEGSDDNCTAVVVKIA